MKKLLSVVVFIALQSVAVAQTYTQPFFGIDTTVNPHKLGIQLSGVWYNFAQITSGGVPTPYFPGTTCPGGQYFSAVSSVGAFTCGFSGVTSVAETFTGGIISVTGSPITSTGTFALTVAGTSGGIPYFSSSSTWASSGALTANLPVIGGGPGVAPTVGSRSGNTTSFATTTGALTNGDCVSIDVNGNYIDAGGPCGIGGGGGTVTASANADRLPYYAAAGNTVVESTIVASRVVSGPGASIDQQIPYWSGTAGTALGTFTSSPCSRRGASYLLGTEPSYSSGNILLLPRSYSTVSPPCGTHDHIFGEPSAIVQPANHSFVGCILCEFYESAAGSTVFVGTDGSTTPVIGEAGAGLATQAHMAVFGSSVRCQGSGATCVGTGVIVTSPSTMAFGSVHDTGDGNGNNTLLGQNISVTGTGGGNIGIGQTGTFAGVAGENILMGNTLCTITGIANAIGIGRGACPTSTGSIVLGGTSATKLYAGTESTVVPVYASGVVSQGTGPSTNFGTCTRGAWTGGPWVGSFVSTGACATGGQYWWNAPKTPTNGLVCTVYDQTNPAVTIAPVVGTSGASIKIQVTSATSVANGDVIMVGCQGY